MNACWSVPLFRDIEKYRGWGEYACFAVGRTLLILKHFVFQLSSSPAHSQKTGGMHDKAQNERFDRLRLQTAVLQRHAERAVDAADHWRN